VKGFGCWNGRMTKERNCYSVNSMVDPACDSPNARTFSSCSTIPVQARKILKFAPEQVARQWSLFKQKTLTAYIFWNKLTSINIRLLWITSKSGSLWLKFNCGFLFSRIWMTRTHHHHRLRLEPWEWNGD